MARARFEVEVEEDLPGWTRYDDDDDRRRKKHDLVRVSMILEQAGVCRWVVLG